MGSCSSCPSWFNGSHALNPSSVCCSRSSAWRIRLGGGISVTALIPAFFGLPLVVLGFLARSESIRRHAMHAAAALALVGWAGAVFSLLRSAAGDTLGDGRLFSGRDGRADGHLRGAVRAVVHRRTSGPQNLEWC